MKVLNHNTTMNAARSFTAYLKSENEEYSSRPYNRYDPKNTTWWVVPGTDWPAFHYGKFVFRDDGALLRVGLNIEKGLGLSAEQVAKTLKISEKSIVDEKWVWHDFVEEVKKESIDGILKQVVNRAGKVFVELGISYINQPSEYDPLAPKSDRFVYLYQEGKLLLQDEKSRLNRFPDFEEVDEVKELIITLESQQDIDWCWANIDILVPFKKKSELNDGDVVVDESKLADIFAPLERWIK